MSERQPIPESVRWEVWERDEFTCQCCGTRRRLSIDHITPVALGGETEPDNLQTLCRPCNSSKGTGESCAGHRQKGTEEEALANAFAVAHYLYQCLLKVGITVEDVENFHTAQMMLFLGGSAEAPTSAPASTV